MSSQCLRFGLLCNGYHWPQTSITIVRSLLELSDVSLDLIVVNQTPSRTTSRWQKAKKVLRGQGLLWGLRNRLAAARMAHEPLYDLTKEWAHIPRLDVIAEQRGKYSQYFSSHDVDTIRQYQLDFLLKFSFGILRGSVLEAARYGIWSFHHGDPERYRGAPPGFWEVYDGNPVTGAILQRLTDKLDGGIILKRCYTLTDLQSASKNYDCIQQAALHFPVTAARELQLGRTAKFTAAPVSTEAPIKRSPSDLQYLKYWFRSRWARWRARWRYLLTDEQWAIGVVKEPIHSFLATGFKPQVTWIQSQKQTEFLADPFGFQRDDHITILAEQYDYCRGYGKIVLMCLDTEGSAVSNTVALDNGTHLSYPCTAYDGRNWFMIPENIARKSVSIYRLDGSGKWLEHCNTGIVVGLIDPTLFQHDGLWWILGTATEDAQGRLIAWFAQSLSGPWQAHALNPVRIDPRNCRSAGTPFLYEGNLYRPTQNSSQTYGGSIVINRVDKLSPDDYQETAVQELLPDPKWPFPHGMHTLSSLGSWTLIDAKRIRFMPSRIIGKLLRRFFH